MSPFNLHFSVWLAVGDRGVLQVPHLTLELTKSQPRYLWKRMKASWGLRTLGKVGSAFIQDDTWGRVRAFTLCSKPGSLHRSIIKQTPISGQRKFIHAVLLNKVLKSNK